MNYFQELELILTSKSPTDKIKAFEKFYDIYKQNGTLFETGFHPQEFNEPSYSDTCKIVAPQKVPKRSNLTSTEGQINLLHAIAHIEYSAIDLAIDAAYRFQNMPKNYYNDWLQVADDEIKHFKMLENLLNELGASYGDVEVHNALFEASQRTQTLLERMAVVPRYLEANGLDATPMILEKLTKLPKTPFIQKIVDALHVILDEEVDHVKKGDKWFAWACDAEGVSKEVYFTIIDKYYPQGFSKPRNVNKDARIEAGFSCDELKSIARKKVC